MEHDFDKTPSYFNTEEAFEKYLGMTSYYLGLQKCTEKLIRLASPKSVAELGSATGATCIRLAKRFSDVRFVGIDMRADVVAIADNNTFSVILQDGDTTALLTPQGLKYLAELNPGTPVLVRLYDHATHLENPIDEFCEEK